MQSKSQFCILLISCPPVCLNLWLYHVLLMSGDYAVFVVDFKCVLVNILTYLIHSWYSCNRSFLKRWLLWLSASLYVPEDPFSSPCPPHTDINTLWLHTLQIPLTVTPSESSIHYWLMVGLIEGPGGLLVLLVNGDPAAPFQSTLPPPTLPYLSISPLPSPPVLGWFDAIDPLHLLTSLEKKIY